MKTQKEIEALKERLRKAIVAFSEKHDLDTKGVTVFADQIHFMSMGAMAFASDILDLQHPKNLEAMLATMERDCKSK